MAKENVEGFLRFIEKNQTMREKLGEGASFDQIVALAGENGFEFTSVEFEEYMADIKPAAAELSDNELAGTVGGCCEDEPGWKYRAVCKNPFCKWTGPWSCNPSQEYLAKSHSDRYLGHNAVVEMRYF